jgi:hypothetical protein
MSLWIGIMEDWKDGWLGDKLMDGKNGMLEGWKVG